LKNDRFLAIQVTVRGLELGFQADFDFGDIHQLPALEPELAALALVVAHADEEVSGVVVDLSGGGFRFVVKSPQTAFA
jgi:hypothetical protein